MNDVVQTRIASVLTAAVGVWLLISPLIITTTGGALVSTLITGSILALTSVVELVWESTLPSWIGGITGVWMALSIVVFGMNSALLWSTLIAAVVTFLLSAWDGIEIQKVAENHHTHA